MPTYSYACTACDHKFDAVQAFTDDALTACPQCSGKLRKLFNSVGVVFKGSGFYRNDSREAQKGSSSSSAASGSASGSSPGSASGSSSGSESGGSSTATEKSSTASPASSGSAPGSGSSASTAAAASS